MKIKLLTLLCVLAGGTWGFFWTGHWVTILLGASLIGLILGMSVPEDIYINIPKIRWGPKNVTTKNVTQRPKASDPK